MKTAPNHAPFNPMFEPTTNPLFDETSDTHASRKEMRQGLKVYQKLQDAPLVVHPFNVSDKIDTESWAGALVDGPTTVRSGQDYNRINSTLILPDIEERGSGCYLSVFVGCYATEEEAARASKGLDMVLLNQGRGHNEDSARRDSASYLELWASGRRTKEQLVASLQPCGECGQLFSLAKCSACQFQFYCCIEHQKEHWSTHKIACKKAKKQRKNASKEAKIAKEEVKQAALKVSQIVNDSTFQEEEQQEPPTDAEKEEAQKLSGFLLDLHGNNKPDNTANFLLFEVLKGNERLWLACIAVDSNFLTGIAEWIQRDDDIDLDVWKPSNDFYPSTQIIRSNTPIAEWFCCQLLRGSTEGTDSRTFTGCNAKRSHQFFVETEGAFCAVLNSCLSTLRKLFHPKVSARARSIYDKNVRSLLRFLTGGVMLNGVVGAQIVKERLTKKSRMIIKEMMMMVGDSRNEKYDAGSAIQGLVNQLVGLIEVWTEKLSVHDDFIPSLKFFGQRYVIYKAMAYPMSVLMIEKGRNLNSKELQGIHQSVQENRARLMAEGAGKKKKKGKKKGRRR
jgi:hypothetical protein